MRFTREERTVHVALWRESGLSKAAYCRECDLPYQTFVAWTRAGSGTPTRSSAEPDPAPAFVQLPDDRPMVGSVALQVRIDDNLVELSFAPTAPAAWVGAVLRAARAC